MAISFDRQMWNMWDLLLYSNIVKRKHTVMVGFDESKCKLINLGTKNSILNIT